MMSTSEPTAVYGSLMLRMALQPFWLRFMVWAVYAAVILGLVISLTSRSPIIWLMVTVTSAGLAAYQGQATHNAAGGLDNQGRSQAVGAVTGGFVPANQRVRSEAIRVGTAYLRGKSAEQLKRQEPLTWMVVVFAATIFIALAVMNSTAHPGLASLSAVLLLSGVLPVLPLGLLSTRRIQRNVALLTELQLLTEGACAR
jgi:hypothetical protein